MTIETATYISDLNATYPAASDPKSEGDDHLRLIKTTVKATFPNVTGPVTATQAQLNSVATKADLASPAFTGTPTAPTATAGTSTTQLATTAFVAATAFSTNLPGQTGNAGKYLGTDGTNASWSTVPGASLQEFTSSGTWTKPAGATFVMVELWGAGGGGGSGRRGDPASQIAGGGGGGGGAYAFRLFKASDLASTESVTIGAGGTGGAARTTNDQDGSSGSIGGNSSFGAWLASYGGSIGGGGTTAAGQAGTAGGVLGTGTPTNSSGAGHFGSGSGTSQPSGFGGGNGGAGTQDGGSSYQGGPGGGGGGTYPSNPSGSGGGISGSSGTGALGGLIYAGTNGVAGNGRQGGSGGAAGYSLNILANNVAFGNGTFALVTNEGLILTSSNGTNDWAFAQTPSGLRIERILHDGTQFVLMGFSGTRCWTTTNFSTFTERTGPGSSVSNFRFANSRYFAFINGGLLQSTDLVTWSAVTPGVANAIDVCWSGTNYVVAGLSSPYIRYSPDLATWTTATGIGSSSAYYCTSNGSGTVVVTQSGTGGLNAVRSTNNGATFSNVATTLPNANARVSFAGSTYFYTDGSDLWTSTDGSSWTQRSTGVFAPTGCVAFDGTTFAVANLQNTAAPARTSVPASLGTWTSRNATARNVAGGTGGAGGAFGAGGGGGGPANNGQNSGAGGAGAPGYARIYTW